MKFWNSLNYTRLFLKLEIASPVCSQWFLSSAAVQVLLCKYQGNSWTATKLCGTCHQLCRRSFSHFLFCQNLSLLWFIIHFWLGNTSYEKIISGISWMGGGPCSKSLPLLSPSNCPLHLDIKVMLCVYFLVIFNTKNYQKYQNFNHTYQWCQWYQW